MQKIGSLVIVIMILTGCAARKRTAGTEKDFIPGNSTGNVNEVVLQNITSANFNIQKAVIDISSSDINQSFIATIKYRIPGEYLISVRSRTGIEAGRIYISKDTILANDRLNRKLYYSDPEYINRKYGVSYDMLPLIFGDLARIVADKVSQLNCSDGVAGIDGTLNGKKIFYQVDCRRKKIVHAEQEGSMGMLVATMEYGDFISTGKIQVPSKISFYYVSTGLRIDIKIEKVDINWEGAIEFIPGAGYEKRELR